MVIAVGSVGDSGNGSDTGGGSIVLVLWKCHRSGCGNRGSAINSSSISMSL